MSYFKPFLLMLLKSFVGLSALAIAGLASANVTYSYHGNPLARGFHELPTVNPDGGISFNSVTDAPGANNPFTGHSLSGQFIVSSFLADGSYNFRSNGGLLSLLFTDGINSYSFLSAALSFSVTVAGGNISQWAVFFEAPASPNLVLPVTWFLTQHNGNGTADLAVLFSTTCDGITYVPNCRVGATNTSPGAWTIPIPEPETYAMLLAGLGLLGFVARRRKYSAKNLKAM